MSIEQLEQSVLHLSEAERRQFLDWMDDHRHELLPGEDTIHPSVQAEVLRRRAEVEAHPELLEPVTDEWFDQLQRKLADVRSAKTPAR